LITLLFPELPGVAPATSTLAGRGGGTRRLTLPDLVQARSALAGTDFRAVVAQRHEDYEQELRHRQIPRVMLSDGTQPENLATPGRQPAEGQLIGTPASASVLEIVGLGVLDP
ncbi:MAG: hypothetical protein ACREN8_11460, partial [Candidatus Dormibacteraceae bacterium]